MMMMRMVVGDTEGRGLWRTTTISRGGGHTAGLRSLERFGAFGLLVIKLRKPTGGILRIGSWETTRSLHSVCLVSRLKTPITEPCNASGE